MSGSLSALALAALIFVGGHFVLSSAPVRGALIARLGRVPFTGLYAVFAAATFTWLIVAYARMTTDTEPTSQGRWRVQNSVSPTRAVDHRQADHDDRAAAVRARSVLGWS